VNGVPDPFPSLLHPDGSQRLPVREVHGGTLEAAHPSVRLCRRGACTLRLSSHLTSVADPNFSIPDPNFSIPDPGSERHLIPDPDLQQRIEFKYFLPKKLLQALGNKIWDVSPGSGFFPHPGSLGQKAIGPGSRIRDTAS
jgi:hypothetical protein